MNVVIPSVHRAAGYALATMLRPHCDRLVAVVGRGRPAFSRSSLYDARYVLDPADNRWIGGGSPDAPGRREYVDRLLDVCRREAADVLWPTNDADLFLLAAHREEFSSVGTRIAAPAAQALGICADKYLVHEAAREVGFPVARAVLCRDLPAVERALGEIGLPAVVKGRWSTNSDAVFVAGTPGEATAVAADLLRRQGGAMVQRYLAGGRERSLHFLIDGTGRPVVRFALRKLRHLAPSLSTAIEVVEDPREMDAGIRLLRRIGLTGFCVIQTREDPDDGSLRLIEVNARFGTNSRILFRLAPDLPVSALHACLGRPFPAPLPPAVGAAGSSPVEDLLSIWSYGLCKLSGAADMGSALPRPRDLLRGFLRFYRSRPAVDIHTRAILSDFVAAFPYFAGLLRYLLPTRRRLAAVRLIAWGDAS